MMMSLEIIVFHKLYWFTFWHTKRLIRSGSKHPEIVRLPKIPKKHQKLKTKTKNNNQTQLFPNLNKWRNSCFGFNLDWMNTARGITDYWVGNKKEYWRHFLKTTTTLIHSQSSSRWRLETSQTKTIVYKQEQHPAVMVFLYEQLMHAFRNRAVTLSRH